MEIQTILEKMKDAIVGEIREELREFKASVTGQLNGFSIAIEALNGRMSGVEARMNGLDSRMQNIEENFREIRGAIEYTNKRIDELRVELKAEIMQNTQRIDETNKRMDEINKRIDGLYFKYSEMNSELKKALSTKEIIDDVLIRLQRIEEKVLVAS